MFCICRLGFHLALLLIVVGSLAPVSAQGFGPDSFSLPSTFGMSMPTSTRQLSMGTVLGCVHDTQFANPAFAANQSEPNAGARVTITSLDFGPDITSAQGHYVHPLSPNQSGLGLTILALSSCNGDITLPVIGAATVGLSEQAFVVDYGRRLADRFTAGLSILGYQETNVTLAPPMGPLLLDVRSRADIGLRAGGAWEWAPQSFLGAVYSWTETTVDAEGLLMPALVRTKFTGDQLAVGASRRFGPNLLGAVEYQHGGLHATGMSSDSDTWHFGLEYQPVGPWSFRGGMADEAPTFGVGYDNGAWRADYALISDWHEADVGALFGGSLTHSVQVIGTW